MATPSASESATARAPRWRRRLVWVLVGALALGAWLYQHSLTRRMALATAYGARIGCACHFVEGRPIGACRADFEPGMGPVTLSADEASHTVTARIPLLAAQTATYRDGPGCQLEPWRD